MPCDRPHDVAARFWSRWYGVLLLGAGLVVVLLGSLIVRLWLFILEGR